MEKFNDETKEGLANMLEAAMQKEGLGRLQVARILKCNETNVSQVKNEAYRKMVPHSVWERLKEWVNSDKTLKELEASENIDPPAENTIIVHKVKVGKEEIRMITPGNPTPYIIEKGHPIPLRVGKTHVYPLNLMEVGDSFKVPIGEEPAKRVMSRIHTAVSRFTKDVPSRKFTIRTLKAEGIIRCWRVE